MSYKTLLAMTEMHQEWILKFNTHQNGVFTSTREEVSEKSKNVVVERSYTFGYSYMSNYKQIILISVSSKNLLL